MICHKCSESIEVGEAMTQVPASPNSYHWWFFHPGCFSEWSDQMLMQETRLNNIRQLAGHVH